MAIPVLSRLEGLVEGEIFYMLQLFFFDVGFLAFHIPAFTLIILGIVLVKKSK